MYNLSIDAVKDFKIKKIMKIVNNKPKTLNNLSELMINYSL